MENLVTCSRVLYDKDIVDKMKEIVSLKKDLNKYKTPKKIFTSWDEWEKIRYEYETKINNCLNKYVNEMGDYGHPRDHAVGVTIKKILTDLTDNEEWASHFSRIISLVINGIVLGSNIDNESLFNILKSCITNLLYSDFDISMDNSIFDDIPVFRCELCSSNSNNNIKKIHCEHNL
jgi:hypothetical protein